MISYKKCLFFTFIFPILFTCIFNVTFLVSCSVSNVNSRKVTVNYYHIGHEVLFIQFKFNLYQIKLKKKNSIITFLFQFFLHKKNNICMKELIFLMMSQNLLHKTEKNRLTFDYCFLNQGLCSFFPISCFYFSFLSLSRIYFHFFYQSQQILFSFITNFNFDTYLHFLRI